MTIKWHIEDVQAVRPDLTDQQASHLLKKRKQNHDASIGINGEVIKAICEDECPTF